MASKTKKQIFITLICTFGLVKNKYSSSIIDNVLTLDALFQPIVYV